MTSSGRPGQRSTWSVCASRRTNGSAPAIDTWSVSLPRYRRTPQLVAIATKSDLAASQRMAEHLVSIADLETR